jgi:hypothetical protein
MAPRAEPRGCARSHSGCAGLGGAHSGQGARVWVERTHSVLWAAASSTSHASRCSSVVSGHKRARPVVAGVEIKASSSYH